MGLLCNPPLPRSLTRLGSPGFGGEGRKRFYVGRHPGLAPGATTRHRSAIRERPFPYIDSARVSKPQIADLKSPSTSTSTSTSTKSPLAD